VIAIAVGDTLIEMSRSRQEAQEDPIRVFDFIRFGDVHMFKKSPNGVWYEIKLTFAMMDLDMQIQADDEDHKSVEEWER
jgi:hypothetical protein